MAGQFASGLAFKSLFDCSTSRVFSVHWRDWCGRRFHPHGLMGFVLEDDAGSTVPISTQQKLWGVKAAPFQPPSDRGLWRAHACI